MSEPKYFAIIPSAGSGSRMHAKLPKQYLPLNGKPILAHTLAHLSAVPFFSTMMLVLSEHDTRGSVIAHPFDNVKTVIGGERRVDSVRNGLRALEGIAKPDDWVFVHDAARPLISVQALMALKDALVNEPVGAILGVPVRDTLKKCDSSGVIERTVDRKQLWAAQTPQAFRYGILVKALSDESQAFTDEASAIEHLGLTVHMVEGSITNFKITFPEDLRLAAALLSKELA
ncbi:MAG: 2-C-methyl-D-erythritol 4-phosphate cytidylyltransferase [Gammaproteobacteria bacterium]